MLAILISTISEIVVLVRKWISDNLHIFDNRIAHSYGISTEIVLKMANFSLEDNYLPWSLVQCVATQAADKKENNCVRTQAC